MHNSVPHGQLLPQVLCPIVRGHGKVPSPSYSEATALCIGHRPIQHIVPCENSDRTSVSDAVMDSYGRLASPERSRLTGNTWDRGLVKRPSEPCAANLLLY